MKKLITFLMVAVCFVLLGKTADAQLLEQDFSGSTTVSDYVNVSTPTNGQFTQIAASGAGSTVSATGNRLNFTRVSGNLANFVRSVGFSPAPGSLMIRFDVTVSGNSTASNPQGIVYLGTTTGANGFGNDNASPSNANTHSRIGISWTTTAGQFSIRRLTGTAANGTNYSGTQTVTWVVNNSGSTLTYKAPDGTYETVANDASDVWIGTTKEFDEMAAQTASITGIDKMKFVSQGQNGTISIDNILVDPVPGIPTSSAASSITSSSFDANWATVTGANEYRLDVSTSNTFATFVSGYDNLDVGNVLTYSVTGLAASTQYYYRVRAAGSYTVGTFEGNNSSTQSPMTSAGGGSTPPTLTAAVGATVDGAFNVTFPDDAVWRAAITSITVGGVTLTAGSSVSAGQITFTPSASNPSNLLQQSGSKNIVVIATGYNDAPVTQSIAPGAATNLGISVQPTAPATNGAVLAQQPVILIRDQYNNTTTSTANVVASVGAGTWSIGGTTTQAGVSGTATFTNLTATSDNAVSGATINFASTGLTGATSGTFDIPSPPTLGLQLSAVGTSYLIDFDNTVANVNEGSFAGTGFQTSPSTGRLNSNAWEVTGMSDGSMLFGGSNTTGDLARGLSTGGVTTGGVYAFSNGGNVGLGFQPGGSDFTPGTLALRSQNKTGTAITSILLSYSVYVRNDENVGSSFNLSYSLDNSSYTDVTDMNLSTPTTLVGSAWTRYIKVVLISSLNISNNGFVYHRWSSDDIGGTGSRDEFYIDDINIIVNPNSSQYPLFSGAAEDISGYGNFGLSGALTVAGTATIASGRTATLGTHNFTGTGGSAAFSGTGTISTGALDLSTQLAGFTNSFAGSYYLTGAGTQSLPASISPVTDLQVNGSGATLTGNLVVTGTLSLNGNLTVGANTLTISNPIGATPTNLTMGSTSSLVLNGTAANIHIPSSVTALNNLTIDNNQIVTADGNLTISGTLTLNTNGFILDMGANTLEIGTSTSVLGAIIRTGSGSIRGTLKRWFDASTTTNTLFPLNNGATDYVGATISFTEAPATGGSLTASYTTAGSGSIPGGFIDFSAQYPGVNLINISPQFWTINADDGLETDAGTYSINLSANNMGFSTTDDDYLFTAILKRNTGGGNTWAWNNANHVTTLGPGTNPTVRGAGFTTFSDFAVGGNIDNPLPVELSSFTSSVSGKNVTLNWSTITETNNSGFDIERKSASATWTKIGNVAGNGTVSAPKNYTYSDKNLNTGNYSYRLKQIDFNGNYKYFDLSNEVIIGTPTKYALSQNFPNPFNPSTSISYEIPATNFVSLKIYDMMGKEVASLVNGNQEAGFYTVKFDASKLSSGIYFYKLQSNDFTATKKLMLLK